MPHGTLPVNTTSLPKEEWQLRAGMMEAEVAGIHLHLYVKPLKIPVTK